MKISKGYLKSLIPCFFHVMTLFPNESEISPWKLQWCFFAELLVQKTWFWSNCIVLNAIHSRQVQSKVVISGECSYFDVLLLQISFHSVGTSLQLVKLYFQIKSNRDQHQHYHSHGSVYFVISIVNLIHYCLEIFSWKVF